MTGCVDRRRIAEHDLIDIWRYIAQDNPPAADTMLDRIETKLAMLADHPLLGTPRHKLEPGMRSAPVGNYTCFYLPTKNGIELIRVLHASRDLSKVFPNR